jgi:hypothetical protein
MYKGNVPRASCKPIAAIPRVWHGSRAMQRSLHAPLTHRHMCCCPCPQRASVGLAFPTLHGVGR